MRRVKHKYPLVIVWTHKASNGVYEWAWGRDLHNIAAGLAQYLVDTKGEAIVRSYA